MALMKVAISRTLAILVPLLPSADALFSSAFLWAFAMSFLIFSNAFALFSSMFLCKFNQLIISFLINLQFYIYFVEEVENYATMHIKVNIILQ